MMELRQKHILVVGLGRSGVALAHFLSRRGARVTVTDQAKPAALADYVAQLASIDVELALGGHDPAAFTAADLVVLSPGVPHGIGPVQQARDRGIPVIGEIELAARFIADPLAAVTGTNGKTTVTTLLGEMLENAGMNVFVGGNIGNPLIGYADAGQTADVVVAEVSSFQLDTIETFRPKVGVVLNITDDHLDRYPDFEAYVDAKARLFQNQQPGDVAVLNGKDDNIRRMQGRIKSRPWFFADLGSGEEGAIIKDQRLLFRISEKPELRVNLANFRLPGRHNRENAAAAALAALALGASPEAIEKTLAEFEGLPHRLQYVTTIDGVSFYDDSKATNLDAVIRALDVFDCPVHLIMGGRNKDSDFRKLRPAVRQHVRTLAAMGECREDVLRALGDLTQSCAAADLDQAVAGAFKTARPGEVVLLSPACASFDMFKSYKHRGECFQAAVRQCKGDRS